MTQDRASASQGKPTRRRRGFSIVPIAGDLLAMVRLIRDRASSRWAKLLVVAAVAYVVCPIDAVSDLAPVVGWLDDAGLILALRLLLHRQLDPYRYPLFEGPAPAAPALSAEIRRDAVDPGRARA